MTPASPVIIVGGGVAGLVLARDLAIGGRSVTLLEAASRLGGHLEPVTVGDVVLDAGAESFAVRGGDVARLMAELDLERVEPLAAPAWLVQSADRARPLPPTSLLGIPASPMHREVIDLIGVRAALRAQLDALLPMVRTGKYENVAELVRRRMGAAVLEQVVTPVVRGVYSVTPAELSIEAASPRLRSELARSGTLSGAVRAIRELSPAGSQVAGIRGGVHLLVERLRSRAERLGVEIRTEAEVLEAGPEVVRLADGTKLHGLVVLAAAGVLGAPPRTSEITLAIAAVDSAELDAAPRGPGALVVPGAPGILARGFTHSSAKWHWLGEDLGPHRHLVRLSYDRAPSDAAAQVEDDLRAITGAGDVRVVDLALRTRRRTLWADPPPDGVLAVGEASSRTGLAAIVRHARELASQLLENDSENGANRD